MIWSVFKAIKAIGLSRGFIRRHYSNYLSNNDIHSVETAVNDIQYKLHLSRNNTDRKIYTSSKRYDKTELDFLSYDRKSNPSIFIDIGANTGYYSLEMWKAGYDKVFSIEPHPETFSYLQKNIQMNQAESIIEAHRICIGETGRKHLSVGKDLGSCSIVPESSDKDSEKIHEVSVIPLLDFLNHNEINSISSVKLGVEGYEDRIIQPFFSQASQHLLPDRILLEHCHSVHWHVDIVNLISHCGYTLANKNKSNMFFIKNKTKAKSGA